MQYTLKDLIIRKDIKKRSKKIYERKFLETFLNKDSADQSNASFIKDLEALKSKYDIKHFRLTSFIGEEVIFTESGLADKKLMYELYGWLYNVICELIHERKLEEKDILDIVLKSKLISQGVLKYYEHQDIYNETGIDLIDLFRTL